MNDLLKITFSLLLACLFLHCAAPTDEQGHAPNGEVGNTFTLPDGRQANDTLRPVEDLDIRKSGNSRLYFQEEAPYNGTAIQFANDGLGLLEYQIVDGEMVRMYGYYASGKLERNFTFKNGKSHGTLVMYYEDGNKYIEENYNLGQLEGLQSRWYENGKLWRFASYKKGKLVKETVYSRSGEVE